MILNLYVTLIENLIPFKMINYIEKMTHFIKLLDRGTY
jgi:hypothetical protein